MKVRISIIDNDGQEFHGEMDLKSALTHQKRATKASSVTSWYQKDSTIEKIWSLNEDSFFDQPKTIKEIVGKLIEKDYHFKASDLTLPLRNIVRNGKLKKTEDLPNGQKSKKWMYVKV